jgi:hypothetical protein
MVFAYFALVSVQKYQIEVKVIQEGTKERKEQGRYYL